MFHFFTTATVIFTEERFFLYYKKVFLSQQIFQHFMQLHQPQSNFRLGGILPLIDKHLTLNPCKTHPLLKRPRSERALHQALHPFDLCPEVIAAASN